MPASFLTRSSREGSAAFTFTSKPLASRCLTQLPQHSQVVDFQTSMVGLAAKAGEPNRRAKAKASNRICITRFLPVWRAAYYTLVALAPSSRSDLVSVRERA